MKKFIFFLLASFALLTSFSLPPVVREDPKDNWVYNLKKPTAAITCNAFYFNPSACDGVISLNSTSDDLQQYPRPFKVTIKFRVVHNGSTTFGYSYYYSTMGANENYHGDYVDSGWPCNSTIVQVTANWYYI